MHAIGSAEIHGLALAGRDLAQPISSQAAQVLGCPHLHHRREMLLGRLDAAGETAAAHPRSKLRGIRGAAA